MLESHMRRTVVQLLKPLHAVSVENGLCHPGTPDVNCTLGWIELKATNDWPVRATSTVRLDHGLSPQQRIWLLRRRRAGGNAWVLVTVARDWLLFDGAVAAHVLGRVTRLELTEAAIRIWEGRTPTSEELIRCLRETSN